MSKTKLLSIAVTGLLLLNLGTLGIFFFNKPSRPHHPGEGPRGEGPKKIIIERLHFDEAQQKEYEILVNDHKSKMFALNDASRALHDALYNLLIAETSIDDAQANKLIAEIADNQKALDELNFDHFRKIKMLCKGSQIDDFNKLVGDLGELFSGRRPPRHNPGN